MKVDRTGYVYIAICKRHFRLNEENEIFLMTETQTTVRKMIVPVSVEHITRKLTVVLSADGDVYIVSNVCVISNLYYGCFGIIIGGEPPIEGEPLMVKTYIPIPWKREKLRWLDTVLTIQVSSVKRISKNFFEVRGAIDSHRPNSNITAYVSIQNI